MEASGLDDLHAFRGAHDAPGEGPIEEALEGGLDLGPVPDLLGEVSSAFFSFAVSAIRTAFDLVSILLS